MSSPHKCLSGYSFDNLVKRTPEYFHQDMPMYCLPDLSHDNATSQPNLSFFAILTGLQTFQARRERCGVRANATSVFPSTYCLLLKQVHFAFCCTSQAVILGKPWVLDPVACGATPTRTKACVDMLNCKPTVVRCALG